jgi:hypothetical protein
MQPSKAGYGRRRQTQHPPSRRRQKGSGPCCMLRGARRSVI